MKKILFTGGGSAGHVLPNVALIEEILSTGEADVCYMGTDGIEKQILSEWKIPYYQIECPKLIRGGGFQSILQNVKIPAAFSRAKKQALQGLETIRPDVVFSKGGYVSLPVVFAARKLKIPCLAHESDLSVGLANKLAAGKCKYVFTSFPETAKTVRNGKYSGAPLRKTVFSSTRLQARKKLSIPSDATVLLVFGGGSGSAAINDALRNVLKTLTESYFVLHVCGKGNLRQSTLENYRQFEFISDMGSVYAAADLVISRAGAGAVFEIMALKKPSLLIPLEGQTRGDQAENAEYFRKRGLCHVLKQTDLNNLVDAIQAALHDKEMKERLLSSSFTQGNRVILDEIRSILKAR